MVVRKRALAEDSPSCSRTTNAKENPMTRAQLLFCSLFVTLVSLETAAQARPTHLKCHSQSFISDDSWIGVHATGNALATPVCLTSSSPANCPVGSAVEYG